MNTVVLDTHAIVKRLEAAGASETLAEAISTVAQEAAAARLDEFASKRDLAEMEARLKAEISDVNVALRGEIADFKVDLEHVRIDADHIRHV